MNLYNKFLTSQLKKLEALQKEGNFPKIAKQYFKVGKTYKRQGNAEKAIYYLERFNNLVGGDDELYDKFTKKMIKQWIGLLICKLNILPLQNISEKKWKKSQPHSVLYKKLSGIYLH